MRQPQVISEKISDSRVCQDPIHTLILLVSSEGDSNCIPRIDRPPYASLLDGHVATATFWLITSPPLVAIRQRFLGQCHRDIDPACQGVIEIPTPEMRKGCNAVVRPSSLTAHRIACKVERDSAYSPSFSVQLYATSIISDG